MAHLKHWRLWLPITIALAMLAALLPGRSPYYEPRFRRGTFAGSLDRAVSRLRSKIALEEMRTLQLRETAHRQKVERGTLTVAFTAPVERAQAEAWTQIILQDAEHTLGVSSPRGRVTVILSSWDSIQAMARRSHAGYQGSVIGASEEPCLAALEANADRLQYAEAGNVPVTLGACSFVLAFGASGTAMRSWIERWRGYYYYGDRLGGFNPNQLAGSRIQLDRWNADDNMVSCRRGSETGCARMTMNDLGPGLIGWMIHTYGAERFGRFWRFDGDLETAAQSAFGVSLGALGRQRLDTQLELTFGGSSVSAGDAALASVSVALCLGLALFAGRRRQVA